MDITNDVFILTSSIIQYNTSDIKRALDTKITEFSSDGFYDYLPFPSYNFELPEEEGPFWKRDVLLIKWDYSEPINDLIPFSNIYLVSASKQTLIEEGVETNIKNINWTLPSWMSLKMPYHIRISSVFEGEEIFDTSSAFTVDERSIDVLTDAPVNPIVANEGNTWTFDWDGHGTSDHVRIELLRSIETHTIEIEETLGRLIGNIEGGDPIVPANNPPLNGDPSNPEVIKVLEHNKYINEDTTYTWTVDDIPVDVDSVVIKITDSLNPFVYDYTPSIELEVPFLDMRNEIGRRLGDVIIPEVSMSGDGEASLSVYGFNPPTREVISGESFTFNYDSTNAVQVYLIKESRPNESIVFPTLDGIHTINNIEINDVYTVSAKDVNSKLKMATFNVDVRIEPGTNNIDIKEFTLLELLNHCISLGSEAVISGDSIIEPGAPILSKVPLYKVEADQMDEGTSYNAVMYVLTLVNEDILFPLINGVQESPKVLLFDSDLRDRVIEANGEIETRQNPPPPPPPPPGTDDGTISILATGLTAVILPDPPHFTIHNPDDATRKIKVNKNQQNRDYSMQRGALIVELSDHALANVLTFKVFVSGEITHDFAGSNVPQTFLIDLDINTGIIAQFDMGQ